MSYVDRFTNDAIENTVHAQDEARKRYTKLILLFVGTASLFPFGCCKEDDRLSFLDQEDKQISLCGDQWDLARSAKVVFDGKKYMTPSGKQHLIDSELEEITNSSSISTLNLSVNGAQKPVWEYSDIKLSDGRIFVCGGITDHNKLSPLKETWLLDPRTKLIVPGPQMNTARCLASLLLLKDGRILILGGQSSVGKGSLGVSEMYDPVSNRIYDFGKLSVPRVSPGVVQLGNGNVIVVGGLTGNQPDKYGSETQSVEILDVPKRQYKLGGNITFQRSDPIVVPYKDNQAVVIGGFVVLDNLSGDAVWQRNWEIFQSESNKKP